MARRGEYGERTLRALELWDAGERSHSAISRQTGLSLKYVGQLLRGHQRRCWRPGRHVPRYVEGARRRNIPVPLEISREAERRGVPVSSLCWDILSVVAEQDLIGIVLAGEEVST